MNRTTLFAVAVCTALISCECTNAQDRSRGRGGFGGRDEGRGSDRGGFRGDRGGFAGRFGGDRGRGGFGGSDRGSGSDRGPGGRGGFSGRPSFGGGPPGGGRPQMDTNGDGRLDQSEIDGMPEGLRNILSSRGVTIRPGISVDDFRNSMREQFMRMREEGQFDRGGDRRSSDGNSNSAANRSQYTPLSPFRAREKERVTVDLPPKYSEIDTDFDGQVGLYEWIAARRESLEEFDQIDVNADGYLTPRELQTFDEISAASEPVVVSYKRERITIISGGATGGSAAITTSKKQEKKASREEREKHEASARRYFGFMDRNRNGKIDEDEWAGSRRIGPLFEQAGFKLEAMSEDEFAKRYVKAIQKTAD